MRGTVLLLLLIVLATGCSEEPVPVSKTGYIEGDGTRLYYEELGSGEPVVMIHGGYINSSMWDGQFGLIAEKFRSIRYDVRGHGQSSADSTVFSDVEDLKSVLDTLEIDKAVIMGLSMGGGIAVDLALKYPDRVSALILVGPGVSGFDYETKMIREYSEKLRSASSLNEVYVIFAKYWMVGPYREVQDVDPEVYEKTLRMLESSERRWFIDPLLETGEPALERLGEISVPTLAVLGKLDAPIIAVVVDELDEKIPNSTKVIIEGAAHQVNMEKPDEFNKAVMQFLEEIK